MTTSPNTGRCPACSAPLDGRTGPCANCAYVPSVSPAPPGHPAPPSVAPPPNPTTTAPVLWSPPVNNQPPPMPPRANQQPYYPPPGYPVPYPYPQHHIVVAAKSPGLAVFFSIWLGAGHLYVGKTGPGVGLLVLHFFLLLMLFTLIGAVIAIPIWCVAFAFTAVSASNEAKGFNHRNGITVY
jgi:TM2 domain-containing membrane protein YozV